MSKTRNIADLLDASGDVKLSALDNVPDFVEAGDNISVLTNDSGYITDYTVTQADVTQHQAALSITESQISDLSHTTSLPFASITSTPTTLSGYGITDAFDGAYSSLTGAPTTVSSFTNDSGYITGLAINGVSDITITTPADNEVLAYDSTSSTWINQTATEAGLLTAEVNDLTSAVTWANVPDANITQSSVTQHQAALSITESQISDLQTYLTSNETITLSGDVSGSGTTAITVSIGSNTVGITELNVTDGTSGQVLTTDGAGTLSFSTVSGGGGLSDIVDDTTPQLGGDLDLNSNDITGTGNINITGNAVYQTALNAQTGTTYTTVIGDASKLVTLTNASAITVTIPPNSSVAYPVGTKIDFAQTGAGQVTFAGGSGVTVNSTPTLKTRAQYSAASCIKTATDTWLLVGDLAES